MEGVEASMSLQSPPPPLSEKGMLRPEVDEGIMKDRKSNEQKGQRKRRI
jgi:hypothetical protein